MDHGSGRVRVDRLGATVAPRAFVRAMILSFPVYSTIGDGTRMFRTGRRLASDRAMSHTRPVLIVLWGLLWLNAAAAQSQSYPARPIRMVVALAAGGPTDIVMRIVAAKMAEQLGQQIVIDN